MIKLVGALFVITGGTTIGFYAANALQERVKLYRAFILALETMRSEIAFHAMELHRIFYRIAQDAPDPLCTLFSLLAGSLETEPGKALSEHVKDAMKELPDAIPAPITNTLFSLSGTLGGEDAEHQIKTIDLSISQMTKETEAFASQLLSRCRCRRLIGFSISAVLAIWLL